MNISKTSWHYRLVKLGNGKKPMPQNLCPYVRKLFEVVFCIVIGTLMCGFIGLAGAMALESFLIDMAWVADKFNIIQFMGGGLIGQILSSIAGFVFFALVLVLALACLFGIVAIMIFISELFSKNESIKNNIAVQYVVDKHNKICRHLDFKD